MQPMTERMLQIGAILAILYFGWSFAAQTVVTILQLQQEVRACHDKTNSPEKAVQKP